MDRSSEALHDTRPWVRAADRTPEGAEVRYTARGDRVWALCWWEGRGDRPTTITLPFARLDDIGAIDGVRIELPPDADRSVCAIALDGMVPLGRFTGAGRKRPALR
jgi:hypothetical protein